MEMHLTVVDPQRRHGALELTVRVPPGSTASDLVPAVARELGRPVQDLQTLYVDGRALSPTAPVGVPTLWSRASSSRSHRTPRALPAARPAWSRSTSSAAPTPAPSCASHPGRHRLGRAAEASIKIEDPGLSRVHAELEVSAGGVKVRDLRSTNGTWLDGGRARLRAPRPAAACPARTGVVHAPGHGRPPACPRPPTRSGEGHLAVNRRPRLQPATATAEIRLPPAARTTRRASPSPDGCTPAARARRGDVASPRTAPPCCCSG